MRKGAVQQITGLILILIIAVIIIMLFFGGSGLFAKSKEQATDKIKGVLNTTSSNERVAFEEYYGRVVNLGSNKEYATKLVADSVLNCLDLCITHKEPMFCYYFDASHLRDSFLFKDIKKLIDEVQAKSYDDFVIEDDFKSNKISLIGTGNLAYTNEDGKSFFDTATPKFEMCCSEKEVYISKLNECMAKVY